MLEANPNLKPSDVKDILSRTATPMPKYFYHEAGAGMLNTYAAVVQAEFPDRSIGVFRSTLASNSVQFLTTAAQNFNQTVYPGMASSVNVPIPANTVQASVSISWALSANDFGLKLFDPNNGLAGESNYLNLPGLTGRREKVVLRVPSSGTFRAVAQHTGGVGTAQNIFGTVELTRVQYPSLLDLGSLSPDMVAQAQLSLLTNVMLPEGKKFRPDSVVSRGEFAEAIVRSGSVPQYMASNPLFSDVRDSSTRSSVESVQSNPAGRLVYDATTGGRFYPNNTVTKLVAAVALVKAAGLDSQAGSAVLPATVADAYSIPSSLRGYVAVALQNGLISLDGNLFNPSRGLTRLELAKGMNAIVSR
jgi:serine protease AprX